MQVEKKVQQYYKLKQKQKEIEKEIAGLREEIVAYCGSQATSDTEIGSYRVKLVTQNRKEYDDARLYETLSDPEVWRLLSKADPSKVAGLVKLNVIAEERINHTYTLKTITLLQVDKK
jgi:cell division septum initiation protein DivIVA